MVKAQVLSDLAESLTHLDLARPLELSLCEVNKCHSLSWFLLNVLLAARAVLTQACSIMYHLSFPLPPNLPVSVKLLT